MNDEATGGGDRAKQEAVAQYLLNSLREFQEADRRLSTGVGGVSSRVEMAKDYLKAHAAHGAQIEAAEAVLLSDESE